MMNENPSVNNPSDDAVAAALVGGKSITGSGQDLLQNVSGLFSTLGHPMRVRILRLLHNHEYDVSQLQQSLGIAQSSVSQHLHALKTQGLVSDRREGKHVFYKLTNPQVLNLIVVGLQVIALQLAADSELLSTCEEIMSLLGMGF